MHQSFFKSDYPLAKRVEISSKIRLKYPDRIPVIVERDTRVKTYAPEIQKNKYIVPMDITIGKFMFELRRHMTLSEEQAIFIYVQDQIPPTSAHISEIYNKFKDEDGFLYVSYAGESAFGTP